MSTLSPSTFDLSQWATDVALQYLGRSSSGPMQRNAPGGNLGGSLPLHLPELYEEGTDTADQLLAPDETPVHLPRGPAAWDVSEHCRMVEPHQELECKMPSGAGSLLRW